MQTSESKIFFGAQYEQLVTSEIIYASYNDADIILYSIHVPEYVHLVIDLTTLLEDFEKQKASKYYKDMDKNRYIICRSLLKYALAYHTKSDIKGIFIEQLPNKKPYLPKHPNVHFNISHSGDYAVLAISTNPIGVDIERIDLNYDFQNLLRSTFDENQINYINNSALKNKTFYKLWTRKEAFVKALGKGIDDGFINIPCLNGSHSLNDLLIGHSKNWYAIDFQLESNYEGCMVFETKKNGNEKISALRFPRDMGHLLLGLNDK